MPVPALIEVGIADFTETGQAVGCGEPAARVSASMDSFAGSNGINSVYSLAFLHTA